MGKFRTLLCWTEGDVDHEASVEVVYSTYDGFRGSLEQPPEDASVEIQSIKRTDAGEPIDDARWLTDDGLLAECFDDWYADQAAAEEYKAEQRADFLRFDDKAAS